MKKLLTICMVLIVAASISCAATITSITANNTASTYTSSSGIFAMNGTNGIIEYSTGNTTVDGVFSLSVTMQSDTSSGGIASASFNSGTFTFTDSSSNILLSGTISSFSLVEAFAGMLAGQGSFSVTGGSLQNDFGSIGELLDVTFFVKQGSTFTNISSFGSDFTSVSTLIATSVPEPATLALLGMGAFSLLKRRNAK